MKIGNPAPAIHEQAPPAPAASSRVGADEAAAKAQAADSSAKVELSQTVAALRSAALPAEFDAAKVALIEQAISDGSFKVDAEAIADKLIANAQEVLGQVKR